MDKIHPILWTLYPVLAEIWIPLIAAPDNMHILLRASSLLMSNVRCCEGLVGGGNDKCDDIQIENNSSQCNDIVEITAGQTN